MTLLLFVSLFGSFCFLIAGATEVSDVQWKEKKAKLQYLANRYNALNEQEKNVCLIPSNDYGKCEKVAANAFKTGRELILAAGDAIAAARIITDEKKIDDVLNICFLSVNIFKKEIEKKPSYIFWTEKDQIFQSAIGLWSANLQLKRSAFEFARESEKAKKKLDENRQHLNDSQQKIGDELQRFSEFEQNQEDLLRAQEALSLDYENKKREQERGVQEALELFNKVK